MNLARLLSGIGFVGLACGYFLDGFTARAESVPLPAPSMEIKLWNGPAPGVPENTGEEKSEPHGRVSHVTVPTLEVYLPTFARSSGTALIICSGGGYTRLASRPLGQYGARRFLPEGIAVFSLKYRLSPPSKDVRADALADVQQAVRIVRSRAAEWNINPDRIGLIGFSAGANLILNLCGHSDAGDPQAADPVARWSCRPDFVGLFAPWSGGQAIDAFKIGTEVPPAFVNHAKDDETATFSFSEDIAEAWTKAGKPVSLELYETGGHMAFNFPDLKAPDWPEKFLAWLKGQKLWVPVAEP